MDVLHQQPLRLDSPEQLAELAEFIRAEILQTTLKNGGHLASNLGVIELTIALHRAFSIPEDRIVFDVSHQCYTHKFLTGRSGDFFHGLRQRRGMSGFCDPRESDADAFIGGHAGTALSAALGLAVARDRQGQQHHVVAVVGDASFSCGLTMEAFNNVVASTQRLIIILNDNEWAIGKNIGAFSDYFTRLAHGLARDDFFKSFGIDYIGPINGHHFGELNIALEAAKQATRPVVIHVRTQKGRGFNDAIVNPEKFHGISGKKSIVEGNPTAENSVPSMAFSEALGAITVKLAESFPEMITVTAAMGSGTGLKKFAEKYPSRFFDTGISEGHAVTFAAGLAKGGQHPLLAIYSTFMQRATDNWFHDVCLQDLPVLLCMDRAGLSCSDGDTHHGLYDIAMLSLLPNVIFAEPSNLQDFYSLIYTALQTRHPFLLRYPKGHYAPTLDLDLAPDLLPIGKSTVVAEGDDLSIWALGFRALEKAQKIRDLLANRGISAEIVHPRFIVPLDDEQLANSAKKRLLVTIEDHVKQNGFGALVLQKLNEKSLPIPVKSFAWKFPVGFAATDEELEISQGLVPEVMVEQILEKWAQIPEKIQQKS